MMPHFRETGPLPPTPERAWLTRTTLEDAYAIFVGSLLIVAGFALLSSAKLIIGGLSGIALLISYLVPIKAGILLMILSAPFFLLAGRAMGRSFLIKTVMASSCLSILSGLTLSAVHIDVLSKPIVALAAGAMFGMGTLSLARHGAGVGGFGALFLWIERRHGVNPGKIQLGIDTAIFTASCAIIAPSDLLWSALATLTGSAILILWQRPPRLTTD